jgi:hypothetical protein
MVVFNVVVTRRGCLRHPEELRNLPQRARFISALLLASLPVATYTGRQREGVNPSSSKVSTL